MSDHVSHEEFKSDQPGHYEPKRGPFDFDMKSCWQRDAEDKENKEKKEENGIQVEGSPSNTKEIKLPAITPRPVHKKNEPVNFSKLMSSGYGDDWFQQRDEQRDEWEKKNSQCNDPETSQSESTQTDKE